MPRTSFKTPSLLIRSSTASSLYKKKQYSNVNDKEMMIKITDTLQVGGLENLKLLGSFFIVCSRYFSQFLLRKIIWSSENHAKINTYQKKLRGFG